MYKNKNFQSLEIKNEFHAKFKDENNNLAKNKKEKFRLSLEWIEAIAKKN